jgi:hypothetical protein
LDRDGEIVDDLITRNGGDDAGAAVAGYQRCYSLATPRCAPISSALAWRRVWRVARDS